MRRYLGRRPAWWMPMLGELLAVGAVEAEALERGVDGLLLVLG
jgi:hypothetical protein